MATVLRIRRRVTGAAGAPATLASGELAYNMTDGTFYAGFGDDGSGVATSVKAFAKDDFTINVPAGGTNGDVLVRNGATGLSWSSIAPGVSYTATGNGIELNGTQFALNYTEIATGLTLSNYLTAATANAAYQAKDADLTAIAALGSTPGILRKTGTDAWAIDSATYLTSDSNLDADNLVGTIDIARLPVLPGTVQEVSSGSISDLTAPQQANIGDGSIVTTTDGRRWIYSGTGSKTAEASYIEFADITPEWSVISNKPSFAAVATTGAYADLSGRPTIGTMAAQNANAVAITGGSIDGVILDGGVF